MILPLFTFTASSRITRMKKILKTFSSSYAILLTFPSAFSISLKCSSVFLSPLLLCLTHFKTKTIEFYWSNQKANSHIVRTKKSEEGERDGIGCHRHFYDLKKLVIYIAKHPSFVVWSTLFRHAYWWEEKRRALSSRNFSYSSAQNSL